MPTVQGERKRRAALRLARIRLQNPSALPNVSQQGGFTRREARKIKRKDARMRAKSKAQQPAPKPDKSFDPLAPITPANVRKEINAQARLEFRPQERAINQAQANQRQAAANTGAYYDDYTQALRESTDRINEANAGAAQAIEGRTDAAYNQDRQALAARNAEAQRDAATRGFTPAASEEGARAVEAQRASGNTQAATVRGIGAADTTVSERRTATSRLARAQALDREAARGRRLDDDERMLASQKGAFKVAARSKMRESERAYAALKKEFGLKERELRLDSKTSRADRQLEAQKLRAQKIVARIYASADIAGARAQIRVAQLQLQKGKISKEQFRTIKNIYEGLPGGAGGGKEGAKPKLQTWEKDKVADAVYTLRKHNAHAEDKQTHIRKLQESGLTLRLARIAWEKYRKQQDKAVNQSPGGDAAQ